MRSKCEMKKTCGGAGSRIPPSDVRLDPFRSVSNGSPIGDGEDVAITSAVSIGVDTSAGRNVESEPNAVREQLFSALAQWSIAPDVQTLRRTLLEILSALD
jgi:hypothetical protein